MEAMNDQHLKDRQEIQRLTNLYKVPLFSTGADPARVQRVHLRPLRFGNGCNAPVQKRTESL